jgi:hypothetical protein
VLLIPLSPIVVFLQELQALKATEAALSEEVNMMAQAYDKLQTDHGPLQSPSVSTSLRRGRCVFVSDLPNRLVLL